MFTLSDGHRYTLYIILWAYLGTCSHYLMCTGTRFTLSDGCRYMFYMYMGIGTFLTWSDGHMYMFNYLMDIGTCLTYLIGIGTRLHNLRFLYWRLQSKDHLSTFSIFNFQDGNGRINYKEFTLMCNVPKQEAIPMTLPSSTSGTTTMTRLDLTSH